jgi:hypothetical protein
LFENGEVFGWKMDIQGSAERILDSVLPHEVTHTIFASHFRQPLPRWADEGACTTVEDTSERNKHYRMLIRFLRGSRGISFSKMFAMKQYPRDVLPLYAQGHSLVTYLLDRGGRHKFVKFLEDGLQDEHWGQAIERHYSFNSLAALQNSWLDWVREGMPRSPQRDSPAAEPSQPIADARTLPRPEPNLIYRVDEPNDRAAARRDATAIGQPAAAAEAEEQPLAVAGGLPGVGGGVPAASLLPHPVEVGFPATRFDGHAPGGPHGAMQRQVAMAGSISERATAGAAPPWTPGGTAILAGAPRSGRVARGANFCQPAAGDERSWQVILEWPRPSPTPEQPPWMEHAERLPLADLPGQGLLRR